MTDMLNYSASFDIMLILNIISIALLLLVLIHLTRAAPARVQPTERERLKRLEHKVDRILTQLDIADDLPPRAAWQELADDPTKKIAAVKAHIEQHGSSLAEAKKAVDDYIRG
jgi:hypothetical protein